MAENTFTFSEGSPAWFLNEMKQINRTHDRGTDEAKLAANKLVKTTLYLHGFIDGVEVMERIVCDDPDGNLST